MFLLRVLRFYFEYPGNQKIQKSSHFITFSYSFSIPCFILLQFRVYFVLTSPYFCSEDRIPCANDPWVNALVRMLYMGDCILKDIFLFFTVLAFLAYTLSVIQRFVSFTKTFCPTLLLGPNKIDTSIQFSYWVNWEDTQVFRLDLIYFLFLIYCRLVRFVRCLCVSETSGLCVFLKTCMLSENLGNVQCCTFKYFITSIGPKFNGLVCIDWTQSFIRNVL